ncbi:hypothetical protein [uncultured Polaribacter sp.]|uniref:hypothetical protein n=1 Tax=uncultured Polaribacter sp. TaxID=174711 RepID=UPI002624F9D3|nr:hypothetical protein [uncultured Polaribacter sp.]
MKHIIFIMFSVFFLVSCNAQTKKDLDKKQTENAKHKIEPKIDYKVNKEYDENGNLIRLDSTYTYYYSNIDTDAMLNDSIFKKFNRHFNRNSAWNHSLFNDFFKQDSSFKNNFFKEDFFRGDFDRNQEIINRMLQKMDSLKNKFFLEQFPLEEKKKKSKEDN